MDLSLWNFSPIRLRWNSSDWSLVLRYAVLLKDSLFVLYVSNWSFNWTDYGQRSESINLQFKRTFLKYYSISESTIESLLRHSVSTFSLFSVVWFWRWCRMLNTWKKSWRMLVIGQDLLRWNKMTPRHGKSSC